MSILNTLSTGGREPAQTQTIQSWNGMPFPTLTVRSSPAELYAAMLQYYNAADAAAAKLVKLEADNKAAQDDVEKLRGELEASKAEVVQLRERLETIKDDNLGLRIGVANAERDVKIAALEAKIEEMERTPASSWRRPVASSVNGGGVPVDAPHSINDLIEDIVRWVGGFADPTARRAVKQAIRKALQGANLARDDFDF